MVWTLALAGLMVLSGCSKKPAVGLTSEGLSACPGSPNCVNSQSRADRHMIAPLVYQGSPEQAYEDLMAVVSGMERTTIITQSPDYLHVEFRSKWMKFVDDVEFWFPKNEKIIHFRSASRTGYSDFGVNRERMEEIRTLLTDSSGS
jgi:uncharacterized protein (DUF1499 family)